MEASCGMKLLTACGILLMSMMLLHAQDNRDQKSVSAPSDEELAARKRMQELLRHPTFISLRLLSSPRDVPRESATDTPAPYHVKDYMGFQLFITQNSSETTRLGITSSYYDYRPELMKDGELVSYSENAAARVKTAENYPYSGSVIGITLKPGEENRLAFINLDDWYDSPTPGRYQLAVRKQFAWKGDWVVSNPVYFEVIPRPAATPIADGVSIELTPEGLQPRKDGTYHATGDVVIVISVVNNSEQPLKLNVIDREYSNRLQLFRDGLLIPYREEVTKRIAEKEQNPRLAEIINDLLLDPKSKSWSQGISLKDWYGPLSPGSYSLTVRHRFEIDGPWTAQSAPLLFEVLPSRNK
jgi:hypothetical protein